MLTNHHIALDGWSLPILLQEIFAGYYGQRLPTAVPYRRFVDWLDTRDRDAARAAWAEVFAGFGAPTLVGRADPLGLAPRKVASLKVSEHSTRALGELARAHHTTVSTVLQAAFAQVLMSITGHGDIAFGSVVSGRPAEVIGAEQMVGLLINTVPVRATVTGETTASDLLDQLRTAHNHTFEHEHLGLTEIHRATGHRQLFDTVFVYENYPTDTAALSGADGLAITAISARDHYHYPLAVQAVPGAELDLRFQYSTAVFGADEIDTVIERFRRILSAMTADPTEPLTVEPLGAVPDSPEPPHQRTDGGRGPATLVEQILADIYIQVLGVDQVGVDDGFFDLGGDSLSAMRAVAAVNAALGSDLAATVLLEAPTVRSLSERLGEEPSAQAEVSASES